jgi:hypothetical protein
VALAREGEQVAHDARCAFGLAEDDVQPALGRLVELPVGEPLRPGEDRGERVVQLVRDAGDGLAERRHLLGLEQLVVEIPRLIVELLPIVDVADQGLDADAAVGADPSNGRGRGADVGGRCEPQRRVGIGGRFGVRRHLDPDRRDVHAANAHEEIGDRAVAGEEIEQVLAGVRIDEARLLERLHLLIVGLERVAENQLEAGIGGQRKVAGRMQDADEGANLRALGEARERIGSSVGRRPGAWSGCR